VGVKVTDTPHVAPGATTVPQLLTDAKSPDVEMLVTLSGSTPVFVSDTSCAGVVVLIVWEAKVNADGNTPMPDASVVMARVRATVDADADAVDTVEIVSADVAPLAPGMTVGGSNAQVVCGGRLPLEQLNVTAEL
jgi:hypothetical protein